MGYSVISTKKLDELEESKEFQDVEQQMPLKRNGPRCVKTECVEEIKNYRNLRKEIWDTTEVPSSLDKGNGNPAYLEYADNIHMYSLSPQTEANYNSPIKATHSNAYNMISIQDDPLLRLKADKIIKLPAKNTQPHLEKIELDKVNKTRIDILKKELEQLKLKPLTEIIKEEKKNKIYEISILSQDLGWPLITKLDKTGEIDEPSDRYTFYTGINPNDRYLEKLQESSEVKKFIDKYNLIFLENNFFTQTEIQEMKNKINEIKNNLSKLECTHLISFLDSLPNINKYINVFNSLIEEIYAKCEESYKISEKNNKYSFGLGYIYDEKTDISNLKSQSNHNLFYIPNEGKLISINNPIHILTFQKQKNNEFKKKMNTYYNDTNIFTVKDKTNSHPNIKIFLTMDNKEEYYLYDLDKNKYLTLLDYGNLIGTTENKRTTFKLTS